MSVMVTRLARPDELDAVGELTASVYLAAGFVTPGHFYVETLRDANSRAELADLLVAVDGDGAVIGSVTYTDHDGPYAEVAAAGEAEFRMLVVDPRARKQGVGTALVQTCLDRAREHGCTTMRLSTAEDMTDAHRLYERFGFRRTPDRDWQPIPGHQLLTYELPLRAPQPQP